MTTDTLRESTAVVVSNASAWAQQVADRGGIPKRVRECASGVAYQLALAGVAVAKLQAAHDADKARIAVLEGALRAVRQDIRALVQNLDEEAPYVLLEWKDLIGTGHRIDAALTTQASEVE